MTRVTASGIVLRRQGILEADRKIALMTETHGKVRAYARGVRWAKGKLAALVEPFALCDFHLYLKEEQGVATLTGGILKRSHPGLRSRLQAWSTACYICELTDNLSPDLLPNPQVFRLLADALLSLEQEGPPRAIRLGFTIQFLREIGYGLREQLKTWSLNREEARLFHLLDNAPPSELRLRSEMSEFHKTDRVEKLLKTFLDNYLPRPLLSADFEESLRLPEYAETSSPPSKSGVT